MLLACTPSTCPRARLAAVTPPVEFIRTGTVSPTAQHLVRYVDEGLRRRAPVDRDVADVSRADRAVMIRRYVPLRRHTAVAADAIGLRDAYANGCAVAIPTGWNELGWAMDDT